MTINIEKKHLVISAIVLGVVLLATLGLGASKNSTYMKRAKNCQKDVTMLYYSSSLLSAAIHDVWAEYIRDDKKYFESIVRMKKTIELLKDAAVAKAE